MREVLPPSEAQEVAPPEATSLSSDERLARTHYVSCVTHRNGEELPRPEPQLLTSLSRVDAQTEAVDHPGLGPLTTEEQQRASEAKVTLRTHRVLGGTALALTEFEQQHPHITLGQE